MVPPTEPLMAEPFVKLANGLVQTPRSRIGLHNLKPIHPTQIKPWGGGNLIGSDRDQRLAAGERHTRRIP